jgi:hypothetical protein
MSDEETKIISKPPTFEENVLAQLEDVRSRLARLEQRENVGPLVAEFRELSDYVRTYLKSFDEKLGVINDELLEVKAEHKTIERRVRKIEVDNQPQAIMQAKDF